VETVFCESALEHFLSRQHLTTRRLRKLGVSTQVKVLIQNMILCWQTCIV